MREVILYPGEALASLQKVILKGHNYIKDGAWINTLK
jgi:hypothetical protein